jgi:hypothetical protein
MTALSAASLNGPGTRGAVSSTIDAAQGDFPDDRLSVFVEAMEQAMAEQAMAEPASGTSSPLVGWPRVFPGL